MQKKRHSDNFSSHLFWDVPKKSVDLDKYPQFIVKRVLEYGLLDDWFFIDIAFLLQRFSLKEILDFYSSKYNDGSIFMAMKSLTYFDDAESDIMPDMLVKKSWKQTKKEIVFHASAT